MGPLCWLGGCANMKGSSNKNTTSNGKNLTLAQLELYDSSMSSYQALWIKPIKYLQAHKPTKFIVQYVTYLYSELIFALVVETINQVFGRSLPRLSVAKMDFLDFIVLLEQEATSSYQHHLFYYFSTGLLFVQPQLLHAQG